MKDHIRTKRSAADEVTAIPATAAAAAAATASAATFKHTHTCTHTYTALSHSKQKMRDIDRENEREQCYVVPAVMSFAASFYPCHSIVSRIERPLLCKQQILLKLADLKGTAVSVLR